jgi:hypothetical protein
MTIIHSFFVSEQRLRTDKERQGYARWMLDRNRFVYRKARNDDRRVMSITSMPFLLTLLSAFL